MCQKPAVFKRDGELCSFPCGKCPICVKSRISDWQIRIKLEAGVSTSAFFITLTYDDNNLVYGTDKPTLDKRDVQLWLKRLRKAHAKVSTNKIRYYLVGEYGSRTERPHYHAIMFNIDINYLDSLVHKSWGKGFVKILPLLPQATTYVLKYMSKSKIKDKGREPEFSLMSKGLGKNYLTNAMIDYHKSDYNNTYFSDGKYKKKLPRYFKKKIFSTEEEYRQLSDFMINRYEKKQEQKMKELMMKNKLSEIDAFNLMELRKKSVTFEKRKKEVL